MRIGPSAAVAATRFKRINEASHCLQATGIQRGNKVAGTYYTATRYARGGEPGSENPPSFEELLRAAATKSEIAVPQRALRDRGEAGSGVLPARGCPAPKMTRYEPP